MGTTAVIGLFADRFGSRFAEYSTVLVTGWRDGSDASELGQVVHLGLVVDGGVEAFESGFELQS
jgi:hypothetical protein